MNEIIKIQFRTKTKVQKKNYNNHHETMELAANPINFGQE